MPNNKLKTVLRPLPLIAILRGVENSNAIQTVEVLYNKGFRVFEIPLNSPNPCKSIEMIKSTFGDSLIIGAGTVLTRDEVIMVYNAGGQIIVSPNTDNQVINQTTSLGMNSIPGVSTPSEAFAALNAGATMLKVFPAEILPPVTIKAWRAVLKPEVWLLPVGGISIGKMAAYYKAGANGFGLGSSLFKPKFGRKRIARLAKIFVEHYHSICSKE